MDNDSLWLFACVAIFILGFGLGYGVPHDNYDLQPQQIKKVEDFPVYRIEPAEVHYLENQYLKSKTIDREFFIIISNSTHLEKVTYGGLMDFYRWTLYVKSCGE